MCQEIYIEGKEATRTNKTCWCPLSSEPENLDDNDEQTKAFADLGRQVWEMLTKKYNKENPSSVHIDVEWKLW